MRPTVGNVDYTYLCQGVGLASPPDLQANGYIDRFSWARVAEDYERQALAEV